MEPWKHNENLVWQPSKKLVWRLSLIEVSHFVEGGLVIFDSLFICPRYFGGSCLASWSLGGLTLVVWYFYQFVWKSIMFENKSYKYQMHGNLLDLDL